jgi:hypothetical protein
MQLVPADRPFVPAAPGATELARDIANCLIVGTHRQRGNSERANGMTRASRRTSVRMRALTKSPGHSVSSSLSKIALSRMVALRACRQWLTPQYFEPRLELRPHGLHFLVTRLSPNERTEVVFRKAGRMS